MDLAAVGRDQFFYHLLQSVQDTLEVITDVARDRRLFLLEATVALLIMLEVVLGLLRH